MNNYLYMAKYLYTACNVMDRLNKEYETSICNIHIDGLDIPDTKEQFTIVVRLYDINSYCWSFDMKIRPEHQIGYVYYLIYIIMAGRLERE